MARRLAFQLEDMRFCTVVLLLTLAIGACARTPAATTGNAHSTDADVSAIRQTLHTVEERINRGDIGFASVFTDDAVIIGQGAPDIVGITAIRQVYADLLKQANVTLAFTTAEIVVAGDLAYERGTYALKIADKASGRVLSDVVNRHVHVLKRQPDGTWKTWRMMVNSAEPPPSAAPAAR